MAHTSPHIHHINTPLWIHSRLPTRTPSIALTLVLHILEYPLSLVYELYRQPRSPLPRTRLFEEMMLTLQGCTSSHTLSPLTAVYTTCTRQPSSGSPARVSATTRLTHKSLVQVYRLFGFHPQGDPARVSLTAPNDVCRVPKPTIRVPLGTPCHYS